MSANPVLAEFVRGNAVENLHRGAFCVSTSSGEIIAQAGDIDRRIFPRSAIKSLQALAMFRSGAVEKYALTDADIALACASHHGEAEHVDGVSAFLNRIALGVSDLECGAHVPTNRVARSQLKKAGDAPTAIHNNCSGKHTGMMAVAEAMQIDHLHYIDRDHAVQKLVREGVEAIIGEQLTLDACGTDGCSIPTFAAPLRAFAKGFARLATGDDLTPQDASAGARIIQAVTSHPHLIAGTDAADTDLMQAFGGNLLLKIGAEGVFCGLLRDKGWGFALKCDDGNMKAAEAMIAGLLLAIASPNAKQMEALEPRRDQKSSNWNKIEVGSLRATDAAQPSI